MTANAATGVRLVPIDRSNWRRCLTVRVSDEQLRFVADHQPIALVILAKSYVGVDDRTWDPLAIERGGQVVGVLGLSHSPADTHMVNLAVDFDAQRAGVGAAAVLASIARCRARG